MRPREAANPSATESAAAKNHVERSASTPRKVAGTATKLASITKHAAPISTTHAVRTASRAGRERPSANTSKAVNKHVVTQVKPGFVRAAIGPEKPSNNRLAAT